MTARFHSRIVFLLVVGAAGCGGGAAPGKVDAADGASTDVATFADSGDLAGDVQQEAPPDGGCAPAEPERWEGLGGGLAGVPGPSSKPSIVALALGGDGEPVVGWQQGEMIFVSAWRAAACGGAWVPLDGGSTGYTLALASAGANGPLRATISATQQIVVERWNGTAFAPLGAPLGLVDGRAYMIGLVADAAGNPVVAWAARAIGKEPVIQAARWSGTAWSNLTDSLGIPPSSAVVGAGRRLSVAVGPDDLPIVAWPSQGPTVARYISGATWGRLGNAVVDDQGPQSFNGPIVNVDSVGHIYLTSMVATGDAGSTRVGLRHLDAGMWKQLGLPVQTEGEPLDYVTILSKVGSPIVGVAENLSAKPGNALFVYMLTGAGLQPWTKPLNARTPGSFVRQPALALDPEGRFVAAWNEEDALGFRQVYVARYLPPR